MLSAAAPACIYSFPLSDRRIKKKFVFLWLAHHVPVDPWQPLPTSSSSVWPLSKPSSATGNASFQRPGLLAAHEEGAGVAALNKKALFSSKAYVGAWKQAGFGPSTREAGCENEWPGRWPRRKTNHLRSALLNLPSVSNSNSSSQGGKWKC